MFIDFSEAFFELETMQGYHFDANTFSLSTPTATLSEWSTGTILKFMYIPAGGIHSEGAFFFFSASEFVLTFYAGTAILAFGL